MANNTIPNVPRKLLERVLNAGWGSETVNALDDLRALLSAPSPVGVTAHEENHHQKAIALYSLILSNVEELSQSIVKGKRPDEKYVDSARIGVMSAWIDRLVHKLPDWEIEYMKNLMKIVVDKG